MIMNEYDKTMIMIHRVCISASCLIVLAGCTAYPRRPVGPVALTRIPVYSLSKTNWNTNAKCMIYPLRGNDHSLGAHAMSCQVSAQLKKHGYDVVSMESYMPAAKRSSVSKIIVPESFCTRYVRINGEQVWDVMGVYSVQDRAAYPFDEPGPTRQYFQVWARGTNALPIDLAVRNLMSTDSFRQALVPKEPSTE